MKATGRPLTNRKVERIPASGIRRFFDLVSGVEGVISLGVGEPDFVTPERFREAAIRSIKEGRTKYTSNYGIQPLRQAISEHTARLRGVTYDPDREILVTVGVSEAVDLALRATLNDGEEVIIADPSYVAYVPGIVLAGGGSLLNGLDERLRHETQMPVHLAESPLTCVAVGSGRSLEEFEAIHRSNRARARSRNGRRNGRY